MVPGEAKAMARAEQQTTQGGQPRLGWQGDVYVGEGYAAYVGPLTPTPPHQHHAIQLIFGLGEQVSIRHASGTVCAAAIWIDSGVAHAIDNASRRAMLLYLEPSVGALSSGAAEHGVTAIQLGVRSLDGCPPWGRVSELAGALAVGVPQVEAVVTALQSLASVRNAEPEPAPPALRRMLDRLPDFLPGPVRLEALAASVHISPSRLSHLVRQHLGTTLRAYVRWLRLKTAARCLAGGATITEAAHAAGFADSAHMNRVFRRALGVAPSSIARNVRWHVVP